MIYRVRRDRYWIEPREIHSSIASQGFTVLSPGWASGCRPGISPSFITIESALSRLLQPIPPPKKKINNNKNNTYVALFVSWETAGEYRVGT